MGCGNSAVTNRGRLLYGKESTWGAGVSGSPKLKEFPLTSESLEHEKETVQSERIISSRNLRDLYEVDVAANGEVNFELAFGLCDDLIAAVLFADTTTDYPDWTTPVDISEFEDVTASTGTYTLTGAGFDTELKVGQWVKLTGFTNAGNNGYKRVATVSEDDFTVDDTTGLVDEASPPSASNVSASMIRNGITCSSYYFEREHRDKAKFTRFYGMVPNSLSLSLSSNGIITGTMGFMGKYAAMATSTLGDGSPTAGTTNPSLNATKHIGDIYEGSSLTILTQSLTSLSLQLSNNLRKQAAIGKRGGKGIGDGQCDVGGSLEMYFEDETLPNKILNHTASGLHVRGFDSDASTGAGNAIFITIPRLQYASNPTGQLTGRNADVMINPDFTGVEALDGSGNPLSYTIQIDKFAAA